MNIGSRLEINMNKYKKNLFSNILRIQPMTFQTENAEQTLTVKPIGGKLKTIRTNFEKAGRILLTFYGSCEKLWSVSPAITSIENSTVTSTSTNQSTESTDRNDSKNMVPSSDKGTGYALESGSNFEESNYSDEAIERKTKIRKLLKNHKSGKLSLKSGAEVQMLQCYKDDLNLKKKKKMIENVKASEENFKECISKFVYFTNILLTFFLYFHYYLFDI